MLRKSIFLLVIALLAFSALGVSAQEARIDCPNNAQCHCTEAAQILSQMVYQSLVCGGTTAQHSTQTQTGTASNPLAEIVDRLLHYHHPQKD